MRHSKRVRWLGLIASCGIIGATACNPIVLEPAGPPPPCPEWPAELDFGEVEVGTRATLLLPPHDLSFPNVEPVEAPFGFSIDGALANVRVTFDASDALLHLGELRGSPGPLCPTVSVGLRGLGSGSLSVTPRVIDFGSVDRGETRARTLRVFNSRRTSVNVLVNTFDTAPWLEFDPMEFTLPPGGEQLVTLTATTGDELGQQTASVRLTTVHDELQVLVTMKPQLPRLVISKSPDEVEWLPFFGVSDVVPRTFQVTNVGLAELVIESVDIFPVGPQLAMPPPSRLAPGASAPVTIFFDTNTPVGSHIWNVRFISDDPVMPDAGTRYQFESRAFAPCDPGLVFTREILRPTPGGEVAFIELDLNNQANTDCLIDDIRFEPLTAFLTSGRQLIIPANNTRQIRFTSPAGVRSLLFFRPMRPGSNDERVVIDTR